jgi:hypothetical protein
LEKGSESTLPVEGHEHAGPASPPLLLLELPEPLLLLPEDPLPLLPLELLPLPEEPLELPDPLPLPEEPLPLLPLELPLLDDPLLPLPLPLDDELPLPPSPPCVGLGVPAATPPYGPPSGESAPLQAVSMPTAAPSTSRCRRATVFGDFGGALMDGAFLLRPPARARGDRPVLVVLPHSARGVHCGLC